MEVKCQGPGMDGTIPEIAKIEQQKGFEDSKWSSWSSTCPPGTAVCALKTRQDSDRGAWDDGALTNARLYCCKY